jgi:transposase-like protein
MRPQAHFLAQAEDRVLHRRTTFSYEEPLIELRRDKRRLEMEVEILKRAAAYFARENVLPN